MKGRIKRNLVTLQATGAALCFGGGILAGIVGSLLTASTWIVGGEQHPWVRGLGTALLIATIPLLISAGYCLDWIERRDEDGARSGHGTERKSEAMRRTPGRDNSLMKLSAHYDR